MFLLLLCAVTIGCSGQGLKKGLSYRIKDRSGSQQTSQDNEVSYSKHNDVYDRNEFFNKAGVLLFYVKWDDICECYKMHEASGKLLKTYTWDDISQKWVIKNY